MNKILALYSKLVVCLGVTIALLFITTTAQATDKTMYTSNKYEIILREKPLQNAKQLTKIPKNSKVMVHSSNKGWSYITFAKKKGYVQSGSLTANKPAASEPIITGGLQPAVGLTLTYKPSFAHDGLEIFKTKDYYGSIQLESKNSGWEQLCYSSDKTDFVLAVCEASNYYYDFTYPMVKNKYTKQYTVGENVVKLLVEHTSKTVTTKAGTFKDVVILRYPEGARVYIAKGLGIIKVTESNGEIFTELISIKK